MKIGVTFPTIELSSASAARDYAQELICSAFLSMGRVRRPSRSRSGRAPRASSSGALAERVVRRAVRLICAGWLPQDGLFGWSGSRV